MRRSGLHEFYPLFELEPLRAGLPGFGARRMGMALKSGE
jgi:hypothetical protein